MTEKGEVKNSRVVHTVIKRDSSFTYEEAKEIIETGKGDFQEEVIQLDKLAKILRENRFKAGAINFDRYEDVYKRQAGHSSSLPHQRQ